MITNGDLVGATCAILIDGRVKGTACLVSWKGHLLTAGHIFDIKGTVDTVGVQFGNGNIQAANMVFRSYDYDRGLDFAVLQLVAPLPDKKHLPVKLIQDLRTGSPIRTYGYGVTLIDISAGDGRFLGFHHKQNNPMYRLFEIVSDQLGEEGYSGAGIYSEELDAIIAIQIGRANAKGTANKNTVLAMPIYRIAAEWPRLYEELGLDTDEFPINVDHLGHLPPSYYLPKDFDSLIEQNNEIRSNIEREAESYRLGWFFRDNLRQNHVVLYYGLPNIEKSRVVKNLIKKVDLPFLPIYTNISSCNLRDIDNFLLDLMDQIVWELSRLNKLRNQLDYRNKSPKLNDFKNGNGITAFLQYWMRILKNNNFKPMLILDQIDELINISPKENKILDFLSQFIANPDNGCFIVVSKESNLRVPNIYLKRLDACATTLQVKMYETGTASNVLSLMQKDFSFSDDAKDYIGCYCDEHPYIIRTLINVLISNVNKKGIRHIDVEDIEIAIDSIVQENRQQLDALFRDLSGLERLSLWLLSRKWYDDFIYSVSYLQNYSDFQGISEDLFREISREGLILLSRRGWIEFEESNKFFKFNFGLMLVWLKKYYPSVQEVLDVSKQQN